MRFTALKLNSLRDLLVEELRDLYNAETQLVDALPKMAGAATSRELKSAFEQMILDLRYYSKPLGISFHGNKVAFMIR